MQLIKELTCAEINKIRLGTEDILENVGFKVLHSGLLSSARAAGAIVDETNSTVRFPAQLLRELISKVPASYVAAGSNGKEDIIGDGSQRCLAIVTDPWVVDYETEKPRHPRLDDIRRNTTIARKLEHVFCVSLMDYPVSDDESPMSNVRALQEYVMNLDKHMLIMSASPEGFKRWLDIAKILLNGRELAGSNLMTVGVAVVSPLTLTEFNGDLLLGACENRFPIFPTICPMAGATSPYTIASTMLLGNTENVLMAAMSQIINPGNPFLYSFGPSVSNLKSAHELYTTMEKILWKTAQVQMAKSYNLPNSAECGGSLTYRYDQQNGAEGILSMLSAKATGTDVLTGIGSSMNAAGMSAEMMIIQSAWLEAAKFLSNGMTMDDTHLAVELIKQAGPGGNFLMDDLTIEYMHGGEFFGNDIFDYPLGFDNGDSMLTRAHNKVEELTSVCESPHPHAVREALQRYFRDQGL